MDLNPATNDDDSAMAVDARIVIEGAEQASSNYDHRAILPYPASQERKRPLKSAAFPEVPEFSIATKAL